MMEEAMREESKGLKSREMLERESESAWHEMPGSIWMGLMAAPIAFALNLFVGYALVPSICANNASELPLHIVGAATALLALAGALTAYRAWRRSGGGMEMQAGTRRDRYRFMAAVGALMSPLFLLLILGQWGATIFYGPCQR